MSDRGLADWLAHAERLHPVGIDLGLHRVREVARRLDVLRPAPRNVVVAGTNGKGSTCVYLEALLRASGRSVGTTLSPHLNRFNERIRVDGAAVDDRAIARAFAAIDAARREITLTYFEFGVLAALLTFKWNDVDACVLEVGLGGRLDAVNIVDADVAVITSIGIDHVEYLGADRETIGVEKAGILRSGKPCVIGEAAIPNSVIEAAQHLGAPVFRYERDFHARYSAAGWSFDGVRDGGPVALRELARPSVALVNAAAALQAWLLLDACTPVEDCVRRAASTRLPGRFEHFMYGGVPVIVDVAHNPHGAAFLREQLRDTRGTGATVAVAGFLQDKDAAGIVAALADVVDEWVFVGTHGSRGQDAATTAAKVRSRASIGDDLARVLGALVKRRPQVGRLVVLGSFDVAQRARAIVGSTRND